MKLIAHRIFQDHKVLDSVDSAKIAGYDGVEVDVRRHANGDVFIYHSPVFDAKLRKRAPVNRFETAIEMLADLSPSLRVLLLDIKCVASAQHAAEFVRGRNLGVEVVFNCWQEQTVSEIRRLLPSATILFCIAPIFSRRLARCLPEDFYLYNRYPFLKSASRFRPRDEKFNNHNINIKIFTDENADLIAPQGADGVCLHRVFFSEALVDFTRRRGLKTAVYGIGSRKSRLIGEAASDIDFAIIRGEKRARGRILRGRGQAGRADDHAA